MPQQKMKLLDISGGRTIRIPTKHQHSILVFSSNQPHKGWDKEEVVHILECVKEDRLNELDMSDNMMNDIGTFFGRNMREA